MLLTKSRLPVDTESMDKISISIPVRGNWWWRQTKEMALG